MESVKSIQQAVEALSLSELAEFRDWFAAVEVAEWDPQIEQDAVAGKLDLLATEALADPGANDCGDGRIRVSELKGMFGPATRTVSIEAMNASTAARDARPLKPPPPP